jgi:hypothetical protein
MKKRILEGNGIQIMLAIGFQDHLEILLHCAVTAGSVTSGDVRMLGPMPHMLLVIGDFLLTVFYISGTAPPEFILKMGVY